MIGVTIGEKHNYNDFGLILTNRIIEPPKPQVKTATVPLRDGTIDLTEALTEDIKYNNRKITLTFSVTDPITTWAYKISEIENYLHGQRMRIIFDDDKSFYYVGRVAVNQWTSNKKIGTLVIDGEVEPYKYDLQSSAEGWLWDTFDFEQGIINELGEVDVNESAEIKLICRRKRVVPTIIASTDMTVTFEGVTYCLKAGAQKVYEILLKEGENVLAFAGNGTVAIDYTGGSL